jgi:hypothetical protein
LNFYRTDGVLIAYNNVKIVDRVGRILDEAPTNIQINDAATDINGFVTLDNDKGVGFVIGTLSATDPSSSRSVTVTVMVLVVVSSVSVLRAVISTE